MIPAGGLLDIEVIPLEFETVTTQPKLEVVSHTRGRFETSREGGEFKAIRKQDNANISRQGRIHAYHSAHKFHFDNGKLTADTSKANNVPSLANSFAKHGSSSNSKSISSLAFEYTPEEVNMDWIRDEKVLKGVPGRVDFYITQYPKVLIDYLGGPLYVPPSSDPNYKEPELDVVV